MTAQLSRIVYRIGNPENDQHHFTDQKDHADIAKKNGYEVAEYVLAGMDSEPVGVVRYVDVAVAGRKGIHVSLYQPLPEGTEVFAAPPAPVAVPDDFIIPELATLTNINKLCPLDVNLSQTDFATGWNDCRKYALNNGELPPIIKGVNAGAQGWNACRAAMLKAGPVTAATVPMQPLVIDSHNVLRFKENKIVRSLLDYSKERGYGLNEIALEDFTDDDRMQLAQLIGYSLSGYGELSYVSDESWNRAASAAPEQEV